jgi:hypothetical protein
LTLSSIFCSYIWECLIQSNSGVYQLSEFFTWTLERCSRFNTRWDCGLGCRIVHGAIKSRVGMLLTKKLQSAVLEGLFAVGRAQVSPAFLSGFNPIASARVSEMQRILREGHRLTACSSNFQQKILASGFYQLYWLFAMTVSISEVQLDCT